MAKRETVLVRCKRCGFLFEPVAPSLQPIAPQTPVLPELKPTCLQCGTTGSLREFQLVHASIEDEI